MKIRLTGNGGEEKIIAGAYQLSGPHWSYCPFLDIPPGNAQECEETETEKCI